MHRVIWKALLSISQVISRPYEAVSLCQHKKQDKEFISLDQVALVSTPKKLLAVDQKNLGVFVVCLFVCLF
jgi:hypothetical protein